MAELVAAVDCGTNSTRLLVGDGTTAVERLMRITRLGEGVDATGRLAPQAIARVVTVLEEFREVIERHGVTKVRATATSAARDAANRDEFFDAAEAALGVRPELLPGLEEGRLSFAGATADLDPADGPFLILDIGGGSTEFVVGTTRAEGVLSCDIGCVRLTEQWIEHDPPLPEELVSCLSIVEGHVDDVLREVPGVAEARTLVGLAGTVSCAAAVEQGLLEYDRDRIHHFRLTKEAVEDVFRTLATETRAERLENPGMEEARADVIVGGLCVLVKVMRQLGFAECLVSEADILDGLVAAQVSGGAGWHRGAGGASLY
jgi:exopolyphosphatase/guanosine-5'-triphosphate,3'-diphosphate pyrophosphatase